MWIFPLYVFLDSGYLNKAAASFEIVTDEDCSPASSGRDSIDSSSVQQKQMSNVFRFNTSRGILEPESSVTLRVTYTPRSSGSVDSQVFRIRSPGGNSPIIRICGLPIGPEVELSTWSINFGEHDINQGLSTSSRLILRNRSPVAAHVQFSCPNHSAFLFQPRSVSMRVRI